MSDDRLKAAIGEFVFEKIGDRFRINGIHIDGVEVTQVIQYRSADQHLTDPADRGPDNSIRFVADKPAMVRVYVRNFPTRVRGVTASVMLQRQRYGEWVDVAPLMQQGASTVTAEVSPDYAFERANLEQSLNFIIPAATMRGLLRLVVEARAPDDPFVARTSVDVNAFLMQTLRIRGIPVQYFGPDASGTAVRLPAPTMAEFQKTAVTTLRMYPVSQTPQISLAGTMTFSEPLTGAIVGGQCPQSWIDILFWLSLARIVDGNRTDSLYYALLPKGIPIGGASGCGGPGAGGGAGVSGDGMTMAHELGHVLGFAHAPCGLGVGAASDPAYPAYEPYDTPANRSATLGEYGFDVATGAVYPPNGAADFMSYCGPGWMSLYHMRKLLMHPQLDPTLVPGDRSTLPRYLDEQYHGPTVFERPGPDPRFGGRRIVADDFRRPVPQIVVTGVLLNERFEVRSVVRVATRPALIGQRIDDTFVELVDANRRVVDRTALRRIVLQACGGDCGCGGGCSGCGGCGDEPPSGLVQALLDDVEGVQTLRVVRGDEALWSREAPPQTPSVWNVTAVVGDATLRVDWSSAAFDGYPVERAVRCSSDGGREWLALGVLLDVDTLTVPLDGLAYGDLLVQVIVSDGFFSTAADPVAVSIPHRAPTAVILWPVDGMTVRNTDLVRLWGTATANDGTSLAADCLHWTLDGESVGSGYEVWVPLPERDDHRVTLKICDDAGRRANATVVFESNCNGRRPVRRAR